MVDLTVCFLLDGGWSLGYSLLGFVRVTYICVCIIVFLSWAYLMACIFFCMCFAWLLVGARFYRYLMV